MIAEDGQEIDLRDGKFKLIKNFIQDLSFENPQNINENNSVNNNNNDIDVHMNVIYKPYKNNFPYIYQIIF